MSIQPIGGNPAPRVNQRRQKRIHERNRQLRITSGNREGRTSNWSQDGFLSDGLDDHCLNDRVEGVMEGPGRGRSRFAGRIVRVQEDGMLAVQLVSFDSAALLAMQSGEANDGEPDSNASSRARSSANKESCDSSPDF